VSARPPALAKLTRPKLYDALPRPRLFALLDEAATRPIVWVCAPPGAGKTTLVASYLEARGLRHLWYQVDIADSDPATFVHYMRMAAVQLVGKKAAALPHFNPEPQQDIARFARTYFREFFSVLPRPTVIALDSFQDARTGNELRAAFAHCARGGSRRHHRHRDLPWRPAPGVRPARRESPHRPDRAFGACVHARRGGRHPGQQSAGRQDAAADHAPKRRLGWRRSCSCASI
jgi:hypothetical protein